MNSTLHTHRLLASTLLTLGVILTPLPCFAQVPSTPESADERTPTVHAETFVLAPFEVRGEMDQGYMAQNTASGSRLNTSLKDTPAPISVYTAEFLQDVAATDLISIADYIVNTERLVTPASNFTDYDAQFRVRGLPARSNSGRSVDFFKYPLEIDTFNTERVEFARGPNSILFGLGSASGNFNVSSKRADVRGANRAVTLRTDSNDSLRYSFDFNEPIIAGKLALRLNGLKEQKNGWRPHEHKDSERYAVAARYLFGPKTTLDFTLEQGRSDQTDQRIWVGSDYLTDWIAKGSQVDPAAKTPYPNAATSSVAVITGPFWVFNTADGTLVNWQNMTRSAATSHFGTPTVTTSQEQFLMDFSLVPKDTVLGGPSAGSAVKYYNYSGFLSTELIENLFVELAFNRQDLDFRNRDIFIADLRVLADTNAQLPSGAPNPNVGRYYVESVAAQRDRFEDATTYRFTASYEFDLANKKLGHHRVGLLGELRDENFFRSAASERITGSATTPPPNANVPEAVANQVHRRTYVDLNGPAATIAAADFRTQSLSGTPYGSTFDILPQNVIYDWTTRFTSIMGALQSNFLNDRLVTTAGYREDRAKAYYSTAARDTTPRYGYNTGFFHAVRNTVPTKEKGYTHTYGAVAHATDKISAFYNTSTNFSLPNPQIIIFPGTPAPSTRGVSKDYGFKFNLMGGKLYATVLRYETSALDDADAGGIAGLVPINNIWTTMNNAGLLAPKGLALDKLLVAAQGNSFNSESDGYEVELIANPTPNWRLSANYAFNHSVRTNYGHTFIDYLAANNALWTEGTNARLVVVGTPGQLAANAIDATDGVTTVAETIVGLNVEGADTITNPEGARVTGIPAHAFNVYSVYTFSDGPLKGVKAGGGARWRGDYALGYTTTNPATRQLISGGNNLTVDANLGYTRKLRAFGHSLTWSLQLNVNNVLNDDDIVITETFTDGAPKQYRLVPPREFILTSTFRF